MFHLSRFQLGLIFVSLLLLRVVVGFHFYKEGTTKLRSGFDAKPFFSAATGPLAPYFKSMLDDPDGKIKLCVSTRGVDANDVTPSIDPELSFLIWDDFLDKTTSYYGFGSPELIERISTHRSETEKKIRSAETSSDSAESNELQRQIAVDTANVQHIVDQPIKAEQIFENHKLMLADFLDFNRAELVSYFAGSRRLEGFDKDGDQREAVAMFVDSLRGQVDTIERERKQKLQAWSNEVESIWDSFELQINGLAVDAQAERPPFVLDRPFSENNSSLKLINQIIPWFDTIIGVLLILGLFSRLASGSAAVFLISVIATQPPLVPGAAPTYFYFIELAACLVIFATIAGRFGGLDFFITRRPKPATESA